MPNHQQLVKDIHQANIKAGWWAQIYDVVTGHETVPRNIGELLSLVHSEISESYEGFKQSLKDDHLPQYMMAEVELADTCIRIYDILGFYQHQIEWPNTTIYDEAVNLQYYCELHLRVSEAMEHFRKGRTEDGCRRLVMTLYMLWRLAAKWQSPLEEILEAKLEYNRNRADHKPENRAKEGGKSF